jgi:hypothetical protein
MPFVCCIGVSSVSTGSSADGLAFRFRWDSANASNCATAAAECSCRCFVCRTSFILATSTRNFAASLAGAIFRGGFRGALLFDGLPGACDDRIASWGPIFQLSSTNLARLGRIFSIAPSIFDSSMTPSCLKEHRTLLHLPKNKQSKHPPRLSCNVVIRGFGNGQVAITTR